MSIVDLQEERGEGGLVSEVCTSNHLYAKHTVPFDILLIAGWEIACKAGATAPTPNETSPEPPWKLSRSPRP